MLKKIITEFVSTEFKMSERFTDAMLANVERCEVGKEITTLDGFIKIDGCKDYNRLTIRDASAYVVFELEKYGKIYDEKIGKWVHNSALNNKVIRSYGCMSTTGQNLLSQYNPLINFS